ncbi:PTS system mannose/fructose/N-acetylgalactosamine-transporter subunit IIB [Pelolinea submarina]|uniref:PTS system mannose-specific IIB component n=1 Tax=Pelolinea submarina TaxID=913107 RepID=A0A3E0AG02_9CHLR|nr:PTS sugar transporter subunit IIB [Pelolinea submarina]REG10581.1 PTS system mannose-specific IIB component [Pelolinea submarina]
MVKLLRLDERLIHGQIAIKWSRNLGVNRILVLNDEAAKNDLIKKSLLMAAPQTLKVAITSMDEGIDMLNDPRGESLSILVLVKTPKDVLEILQRVEGIKKVNIGNYGRVASRIGMDPRKTYRNNLYLYDSEASVLKQILETGVECVYQTTPEDNPESINKII